MRVKFILVLATSLVLSLLSATSSGAASPAYYRLDDTSNIANLNSEFDMTAFEYIEDPALPNTHVFNIHLAKPIRNNLLADSSRIMIDLHTDSDSKPDFALEANNVDNLAALPSWEAAVWNVDSLEYISGCDAKFIAQTQTIQFQIAYSCLRLPVEFGVSAYSDYIYGDGKSYDYIPEGGKYLLVRHSFGEQVPAPKKTETTPNSPAAKLPTTKLPLLVPSGEMQGTFKKNDLIGVTNPIYLPNLESRLSCSMSTVKLLRNNNRPFIPGDVVKIESAIENGKSFLNSAMQNPGQPGIREIFSANYTNLDPTIVGLNIALCTTDISSIIPRYLTVDLTLSNPARKTTESLRVFMQVIKDEKVSSAVENLRNTCALGAFSSTVAPLFNHNLTIEQAGLPAGSSGQTTLSGTLFRQGIIGANEKLNFYRTKSGEPGDLIGSAQTDRNGQFTLKLNVYRIGSEKTSTIFAYVPERTDPFGQVAVAYLAFVFPIEFDWEKSGAYVVSPEYDWIPTPIESCLSVWSDYQKSVSNKDDRHPLAFYVLGKILRGSKDKQQYVSLFSKQSKDYEKLYADKLKSSTSVTIESLISDPPPPPVAPRKSSASPSYNSGYSASGGGTRCHSVSGYTTKKGKRVSGYIRCR
jgi:hypothetical protein